MKGTLSAIIMGFGFALIGAAILVSQFVLHLRCTEQTKGTLVSGNLFQGGQSALMLEFTVKGEAYRLPVGESSAYQYGDTVTVNYNPTRINRHNFYISEAVITLRVLGIACLAAGALFVVVGGAYRGWFF